MFYELKSYKIMCLFIVHTPRLLNPSSLAPPTPLCTADYNYRGKLKISCHKPHVTVNKLNRA